MMRRRAFVQAALVAPIVACQREPKTPLAHLHGQQWVHGAYEMYADRYLQIERGAESHTNDAYRVLAHKGIVALDGLQAREVPFFIRADAEAQQFTIARSVPERLTFTADMSEADRQAATADWKLAREHIHTDYDEIHRLDWALTTLLGQLQSIRNTVDQTRLEQFQIATQITEQANGSLPFELPFQVTSRDYERVLFLLLDRLEDDGARLERIESAIIAVGLTARATDGGSGSLAGNVRKVLLSVVEEAAASSPRPATFPSAGSEHDALVAKGRKLHTAILASPEYAQWVKQQQAEKLQQIGSVLSVLDALTGIPVSAVFKQAINLWSGDGDYLAYLQTALGIVPGGGNLSKTLDKAITTTRRVRAGADRLQAIAKGKPFEQGQEQAAGLLNVGSRFARERVNRQLVFYENQDEVREVEEALAKSDILRGPLPKIPEANEQE